MVKKPNKQVGEPTNLYLTKELKAQAKQLAAERYDCSLSELVEGLLAREMSLKRGMLNRRAA